jgi:hypothetical protein
VQRCRLGRIRLGACPALLCSCLSTGSSCSRGYHQRQQLQQQRLAPCLTIAGSTDQAVDVAVPSAGAAGAPVDAKPYLWQPGQASVPSSTKLKPFWLLTWSFMPSPSAQNVGQSSCRRGWAGEGQVGGRGACCWGAGGCVHRRSRAHARHAVPCSVLYPSATQQGGSCGAGALRG